MEMKMEKFKMEIGKLKKEFTDVTESDRDIYYGCYIGIEYDESVNKKIGIDESIHLKGFCTLGGYKEDFEKTPERIPITVSLSFAYYNEEEKSYPLMLPKGAKLAFCPRNYEIKNMVFYNENDGEFYLKNKKLDILQYIKEKIKENNRVLREFTGRTIRIKRRIVWYIINPILKAGLNISTALFHCLTGDNLNLSSDQRLFHYFMRDQKIDLKVLKEEKANTVDFFGMKVKYPPLISYSAINLLLFIILFAFNYKPHVLKVLFNNTYFTILYVIISYCLMLLFGKLFFRWTSNLFINGVQNTRPADEQGYVY
jgi:hypothetical protein